MYYLYNINSQTRTAWRNASEVQLAALEHEKRRFQMGEEGSLGKPQILKKQKRSGWAAVLKASSLLLSILTR